MVIAILILLPFLVPATWGGSANSGSGSSGSGVSGTGGSGGGSSSSGNGGNISPGGIGGGEMPTLTSRVVHTKYGAVSGVIVHLEGRNLDPVEAFKGIPYASPPVGSLRFMPPVTGALWSGVKKADR